MTAVDGQISIRVKRRPRIRRRGSWWFVTAMQATVAAAWAGAFLWVFS